MSEQVIWRGRVVVVEWIELGAVCQLEVLVWVGT